MERKCTGAGWSASGVGLGWPGVACGICGLAGSGAHGPPPLIAPLVAMAESERLVRNVVEQHIATTIKVRPIPAWPTIQLNRRYRIVPRIFWRRRARPEGYRSGEEERRAPALAHPTVSAPRHPARSLHTCMQGTKTPMMVPIFGRAGATEAAGSVVSADGSVKVTCPVFDVRGPSADPSFEGPPSPDADAEGSADGSSRLF